MSGVGTATVGSEGVSFELDLTRAALLKTGGLALVAAALPGGKRAVSLLSGIWGPPAHLRLETYLPHVASTFLIRRRGTPPLRVRLTKITKLDSGSFALVFRGPRSPEFEQSARLTVTHPALGRFPLAVVPIGSGRRGQLYEAIVARGAALSERRRVDG